MYKKILVPLDGSKLAERALDHAVTQARQFGAEILVLKVLGPLPDVKQQLALSLALIAAEQLQHAILDSQSG